MVVDVPQRSTSVGGGRYRPPEFHTCLKRGVAVEIPDLLDDEAYRSLTLQIFTKRRDRQPTALMWSRRKWLLVVQIW